MQAKKKKKISYSILLFHDFAIRSLNSYPDLPEQVTTVYKWRSQGSGIASNSTEGCVQCMPVSASLTQEECEVAGILKALAAHSRRYNNTQP